MIKKKNIYTKKILAAVAVLASAGMITACSGNSKKVEDKYINLNEYYGVSAKGEYGIVVDGNPTGTAVTVDDKIYLPQELVVSEINSQFYYDKGNNQIRYASPNAITVADVDGEDGRAVTYNGKVYLELTYVVNNSEVKQIKAGKPDRIVVFTDMGETDTYEVLEDVKLRSEPKASSGVLTDLSLGQTVYELEELQLYGDTVGAPEADGTGKDSTAKGGNADWKEIVTEQGIRGYVESEKVLEGRPVDFVPNQEQPDYTHISLGEKVCLGWQMVTNKNANNDIENKIKGASGLNVVSPTWYTVSDTKGGLTSLASKAYVNTAHSRGLQVWALVNDFAVDDNGVSYVLETIAETSGRTALINRLISEAEEYGFDGINVDFEKISKAYAMDYVQFMRELSVACRENGIILSADMYVPMSYNQYYNRSVVGEVADYLVIMGYDEHWAGCDTAGSVASIAYVTNGINNTIKCVDADRVINAIPFYTRIWSETPEDIADGKGTYVEDSINGNYYLGSRAVGMETAEREVESSGAEKLWLDSIGQYYAEYSKNGVLYRVWLEDEKSTELKLSTMENAGLAGVACWQLGYEKPEIWNVIQTYLDK